MKPWLIPTLLIVVALGAIFALRPHILSQKLHPWYTELESAVSDADTIVLSDCWFNGYYNQTFQMNGRDNVESFLESLTITDSQMACMCGGDFTLSFRAGERELARLSYHHNRTIRWNGGPWGADAVLQGDSARRVLAWLESVGHGNVAREVETRNPVSE